VTSGDFTVEINIPEAAYRDWNKDPSKKDGSFFNDYFEEEIKV
jgi:hypothetical protein